MLKKSLLVIALGLGVACAQAQPQQPAPAVAAQSSSPAKKELIARIIKQQQPAIENMARNLVEQPAFELLGSAGNALPARVAKDRQDAVAKEIQADVQKYLADAVPLVQARAVKLGPTAIGSVLDEKFSEDELKQLVGIIESPVYGKFQRLGEEMQKALADKLVADTRGAIEPKVRALEQVITKRLGMAGGPGAGAAPTAAAGPRAAGKPAAK